MYDECLNKCDELVYYKERTSYLEKLVKKYKFDYLTGLMGKIDFIEKLDKLFDDFEFADEEFIFILIDINDLHNINRKYGYHSGDLVIKQVAAHLQKYFQFHHLFRISGDEFAILIRSYHLDEKPIIKHLDALDKITYYIGKSPDYQNAKQMFKEIDSELSKKKETFKRI